MNEKINVTIDKTDIISTLIYQEFWKLRWINFYKNIISSNLKFPDRVNKTEIVRNLLIKKKVRPRWLCWQALWHIQGNYNSKYYTNFCIVKNIYII